MNCERRRKMEMRSEEAIDEALVFLGSQSQRDSEFLCSSVRVAVA